MKKMMILFSTCLFFVHTLHGYYNERHYEGLNPAWKQADTVGERLKIIEQFLPINPMVFEAGAKDGDDSIKLAAKWPAGKIISFEPNPHQFVKYIEKSLKFNNMSGYNLAVNTYNGTTKFYLCWGTGGTDPVFEGASSILEASDPMKVHYMGPEIEVPCVILDDWCKDNGITNFDFMWLDLEGFELQLLQSSPRILRTVKLVYTETNFFEFRKGTTQFGALKQYLESQGFRLIAHWYNEGLQGDAIFIRK